MSTAPRGGTARRVGATAASLALLLTGCTTGSSAVIATGTTTGTVGASADPPQHPAGPWRLVSWIRSATSGRPMGLAEQALVRFEGDCPDATCALRMLTERASRPGPTPRRPHRPALDGRAVTLTFAGDRWQGAWPEAEFGCPGAGPSWAPTGLRVSTRITLRYAAPPGQPVRLVGELISVATPTESGVRAGCAGDTIVSALAGGPATGPAREAEPVGSYLATVEMTASTPAGTEPAEEHLTVGVMTVSRTPTGLSITGQAAAGGVLLRGQGGWSGAAAGEPGDCPGPQGVVAGGQAVVEAWSDLTELAWTGPGGPILGGTYRFARQPNPIGQAAGCVESGWQGRLLLVPTSLVAPPLPAPPGSATGSSPTG